MLIKLKPQADIFGYPGTLFVSAITADRHLDCVCCFLISYPLTHLFTAAELSHRQATLQKPAGCLPDIAIYKATQSKKSQITATPQLEPYFHPSIWANPSPCLTARTLQKVRHHVAHRYSEAHPYRASVQLSQGECWLVGRGTAGKS